MTERFPVPTDDVELRIERDELGRAYWPDGRRITSTAVLELDEYGDPRHDLVDALIQNGLWVLRDGHEALVTWDGIISWLEAGS